MMEHHNTETPRRLRAWVHVKRGDGPNAEYVAFGPSDDLPQWVIDQLADNPKVWAADNEPEAPQPAALTMIGHAFEPGSLVSGPMMSTSALPPSSTPMTHPSRGSGRPQAAPAAGAEPGLAEAARRFGPPGDDAA